MSSSAASGLTISAVAERTGLTVPVLRAWERRFGFPHPDRLESGHRRYAETEVERIRHVVAARAAGRSLESAIELARSAAPGSTVADESIFAGLRRARPDLGVSVLSRRAMLALSRAIEDECLAQADRPHLVAAFQHEHLVRRAHRRWEALAVTSAATLVLADFGESRLGPAGSLEIALPSASPARREWSVVCDAPASAAVLVGWERPDGTFEAMWTVDPDAVRVATSVARHLASVHAPLLPLPPPPAHEPLLADPALVLRRATDLTNRVVRYLDR